jgi:SM-20-related protein
VTVGAVASTASERVVAAIGDDGFAVEEGFLARGAIAALAADARRRDAAGAFRAAGVGRGAARRHRNDLRGDRICWLDGTDDGPAMAAARAALEGLRTALNAALLLGLFDLELHYAIYPPGATYLRHLDRFRDDDARVLSCVLYLNDDWRPEDGGALRIHLRPAATRDVLPVGGTLACFLSERFEHEVLPATRERLALTGWYRRRG